MPTPNDDDNLNPDPSSGEGNLNDDDDLSDLDANLSDDDSNGSGEPHKKTAGARINELVAELKQTREELEKVKEGMAPPAPPSDTKVPSPEVQKAVEYLKSLGFTQKTDVEEKVKTIEERMALNSEHTRLEGRYDGEDGRPRYDRKKVEDFMREKGVYDPEVAYKALHETELLDYALKKAGGKTEKPYIEKPGGSVSNRDDNTITREKIAEWMKTPEGRIKYEQNRDKILDLLSKGQIQ